MNDRVYLRHSGKADRGKKLRSLYDGPYFVVEIKDNNNVLIRKNNGRKLLKVNAERLKLVKFTPVPGTYEEMLKRKENCSMTRATSYDTRHNV